MINLSTFEEQKVEEHHLYSLLYMHFGAPKIWYGIPARYLFKFEAALKRKYPHLLQYPELHHKLVSDEMHASLLYFKARGVSVAKTYGNLFLLAAACVCAFQCVQNQLTLWWFKFFIRYIQNMLLPLFLLRIEYVDQVMFSRTYFFSYFN